MQHPTEKPLKNRYFAVYTLLRNLSTLLCIQKVLFHFSHVCQQCIVRGVGLGLGFGLEIKERSKEDPDTTKSLMAVLDVTHADDQ